MLFKYVYNCFCPRIVDEDDITRDNSDDSIATILPSDSTTENEFNHHPVPDGARTPTRGAAGVPAEGVRGSPSATHHAILLLLQLPIIVQ